MKNRYKIIIAYDGTDFQGWQHQINGLAIANRLQDNFERTFKSPVHIIGASRTDTGVHALGQVALVKTDLAITPGRLHDAWNKSLPSSIRIRSVSPCHEAFHPCFGVAQKTYWYMLFLGQPLPFVARYGWHYHFINRINIEKFNAALQLYAGTHDFGSFCKQETDRSTIRTIDTITLHSFKRWGMLGIQIKGKSFLHFQIRRMLGYALDVACRPTMPVSHIQHLLDNPHPEQTLLKAGASGLCLRKIVYHDDIFKPE